MWYHWSYKAIVYGHYGVVCLITSLLRVLAFKTITDLPSSASKLVAPTGRIRLPTTSLSVSGKVLHSPSMTVRRHRFESSFGHCETFSFHLSARKAAVILHMQPCLFPFVLISLFLLRLSWWINAYVNLFNKNGQWLLSLSPASQSSSILPAIRSK